MSSPLSVNAIWKTNKALLRIRVKISSSCQLQCSGKHTLIHHGIFAHYAQRIASRKKCNILTFKSLLYLKCKGVSNDNHICKKIQPTSKTAHSQTQVQRWSPDPATLRPTHLKSSSQRQAAAWEWKVHMGHSAYVWTISTTKALYPSQVHGHLMNQWYLK